MGIIKELPNSVINQIAAGEVVERPASVVKELLENAIDAGASRVEVAVERGGKDLVRVIDDGKGIDFEDLTLAFQPHATSKLTDAEDLYRVRTLGFRGEALAAISEVSKVRCRSRALGSSQGFEIAVEGGIVVGPIKEAARDVGTTVEVRNLFFNTPVRRGFLKTDSTEAGHVGEVFTRVALAHPTVHLTFRSAGKIVHDLPAVTGIKERVGVFFGQETADSLVWIESRIDQTHLWGYVARPSQSRASGKGQYFFVGGRSIRDRALGHALGEAYRGLLMVGRQPVAFLYLELPPEEVDVNVHPSKIEVRFRDGHRIYSQLLATVRESFLNSDLHSRLQTPLPPPSEPENSLPAHPPSSASDLLGPGDDRGRIASWFSPSKSGVNSASSSGASFQPYPSPGYAGGSSYKAPDWTKSLPDVAPKAPGELFDEFAAPAVEEIPTQSPTLETPRPQNVNDLSALGDSGDGPTPKAIQMHDSYLVVETSEGMVVIDQHALHERIVYEDLRGRLASGGIESQRLLVPEPVDLTAIEAAEVLERKDVLAKLGLGVEPFGGDTVLVTSLPALLSRVPADRLLRDLADHFRTKTLEPTSDALLNDVLSMIACKAAIKAGQKLSPEEIDALLARRHLTVNTHHCPHGRPTALVLTKADLEKQFGRI